MRRLAVWWSFAAVVAACSGVNYQLVTPDGSDAGTDAEVDAAPQPGTSEDAAADAVAIVDAAGDGGAQLDADADIVTPTGPCDLTADFQLSVPVGGLQDDSFDEATLTADELTVYLQGPAAEPGQSYVIWTATRATLLDDFSPPVPVGALNVPGSDTFGASLSDDGKTLFYRQDTTTDAGVESTLFQVDRWADGGFGVPVAVEQKQSVLGVSLSANGHVYTSRYEDNTTYFDIEYQPTITTKPVKLLPLDSNAVEAYPAISADELTIFFASTRDGADPLDFNSNDMYVATRPTASADFGQPQKVVFSTAGYFEAPDWLSRDGCRLYYSTNNTIGGVLREYMAVRPHR